VGLIQLIQLIHVSLFNARHVSVMSGNVADPTGASVRALFPLCITQKNFFHQAAKAILNTFTPKALKLKTGLTGLTGQQALALLFHLSDKGVVEKHDFAVEAGEDAKDALTRFGFDKLKWDCRLYTVRLQKIVGEVTAKHLLRTDWSNNRPVLWVISTKSVFEVDPQHAYPAMHLNLVPLYTMPVNQSAVMHRNQRQQKGKRKLPFEEFETEAFTCKLHDYNTGQQGDCAVLTVPMPRFPLYKPTSLCMSGSSNPQGRVANATTVEFEKHMFKRFVGDGHLQLELQFDVLLGLGEEDLSRLGYLFAKTSWTARTLIKHLMRAPWIATSNVFYAKQGTSFPLGAQGFDKQTTATIDNLGFSSDSFWDYLARRAFVGDNSSLKIGYDADHVERQSLPLSPDDTAPGANIVRTQQETVTDAFDDFDTVDRDSRRHKTVNLRMQVTSFSFLKLEMRCIKHSPRKKEYKPFSPAQLAEFADTIKLLALHVAR